MSGGSGDADLYVRFGEAPTTSSYDCRPYETGNSETCDITNIQAGTYYVMVRAYSTFSGLSLTGSFTEPSNGGGSGATPVSGSASDLSAARNEWVYFNPITLSGGYSNLTVTMSGGSGDGDLYLREGAQPTTNSYNCRPYESGNNEVCDITSDADGDWYIGIRAYRAFSGVSITYTAN
jgi:serine protease